jgi:hypothetical protein
VAANHSWNMAAQFKLTNFEPLTSTYDCPFIVQVRRLKIVPFDNLSYHTSLSYPFGTWYIILFLVQQSLGCSLNFIANQW